MARARLLSVCTGNSARSQIAEGLFRHEAGERFEVFSAGTEPAHIRPEAIQVMEEIGIDISQQKAKSVDALSGQRFDLVSLSEGYAQPLTVSTLTARKGCFEEMIPAGPGHRSIKSSAVASAKG